MRGDKILRDVVYEGGAQALLRRASARRCRAWRILADVSTPVLLPAHFERFDKFNRVKFQPSDFIEEVDFSAFVLERVKDDKPVRHVMGRGKVFPVRLR